MIDINFKLEIGKTLTQYEKGKIKKKTAEKKFNNLLALKDNDLFKGKKREIKKEIFKAKKFL